MLHEVNDFDHTYKLIKPEPSDFILMYQNNSFAGNIENNVIEIPQYKDCKVDCLYLFTISSNRYFLTMETKEMNYMSMNTIRNTNSPEHAFALMNGYHIFQWFQHNVYCGCCGHKLVLDKEEFMLRCESCGNLVYPRINPAVNVAIIDDNRILLAKHGKNKPYALISGFVEYGESLEDTINREVKEEVGLKVKNIRYYGSQPWGFAGNIQIGFTCHLNGSDHITLETKELYDARFFTREEVINEIGPSSITGTMIQAFIDGKI